MTPDYDVAVIGGGPAGIAAAVRARWLKRHHAVCCKVVIIDPAALGGLAAMGSTALTGLSFQMDSDEILEKLVGDVRTLQIPHLRERVTEIHTDANDVTQISLASGRILTSTAVVLASGMRQLTREAHYWGRGVTGLSMGIDRVLQDLKRLAADSSHRRIVFVGSQAVMRLQPILDAAMLGQREFIYVVEPIEGHLPESRPEGVTVGTIESLEGDPRLQRVVVRRTDGSLVAFDSVDLLVMDFLSLESRPARSFRAPRVELDGDGFIVVDRLGHTSARGVFAAGDATGMPACVAKALGEGIVAGFEAYRYVYQYKFQLEPQLFAYFPWHGDLSDFSGELPTPTEYDLRLELLIDPVSVESLLKQEDTPEALIRELVTGCPRSPKSLALAVDLPLELVGSVARFLLIKKAATLR